MMPMPYRALRDIAAITPCHFAADAATMSPPRRAHMPLCHRYAMMSLSAPCRPMMPRLRHAMLITMALR